MSVIEDKVRLSSELPAESFRREAPPTLSHGQNTNRALVPVAQPLHRMHEGRVVRSPGRMLVGSPVPVPTRDDILNDTLLFSARRKRRGKLASSLVVILTCLATAGIAISATHYLSKHRKAVAGRVEGKSQTPSTQQLPVASITSVPRSLSTQPETTPAAPRSANLSVRDIAGVPGVPLPLGISVVNVSPDEHSFLMLHNLPRGVVISAGFPMKGAWAVSLRDLDKLTLQTPETFGGGFRVEAILIKGNDQQPETRPFTVIIAKENGGPLPVSESAAPVVAAKPAQTVQGGEKAAPAEPQYVAAIPAPSQAPRAPSSSKPVRPVTASEEAPLLAKAKVLRQNFDITGARLVYEYLARRGSSKAALEMAQTFDPAFFDNANIRGMQADVEMARQWYAKATELGNDEAAAHMRTLAQR